MIRADNGKINCENNEIYLHNDVDIYYINIHKSNDSLLTLIL